MSHLSWPLVSGFARLEWSPTYFPDSRFGLVGVEFNVPLDTVGHFAGGFALCLEPQHCLKALYHPVLKDFLFFNILNISSDIYLSLIHI